MFIQLRGLIETFRFVDFVDIVLVAVILYLIYKSIRDTRAVALLKGVVVLAIISALSRLLDLHVVNWLIQQSLTMIMVALPVIFQPELRRGLERLGRGGLFRKVTEEPEGEMIATVEVVVEAVKEMSRTHTGALIVFEREVGLAEYIDTGVMIDGTVSRDLIEQLFVPNTPLHDGAIVIRGTKVMAARCILPLTHNNGLNSQLGTRHRAAIGLSEQTDAVVVVVSEETGQISYTYSGHIYRNLQEKKLREVLSSFLIGQKVSLSRFLKWGDDK